MAKAKKVSFNQATAKSTEGHNDRSMYKHGYEERSKNIHWDMYDCGSSVEAEARFYEDTFRPTLDAQNAKARKMRKPDRVMDMKTWHKKHPLKECIVQLGDVENNDTSREFAIGAVQVIRDAIEAAGGILVSWDLHDDERTEDEVMRIIIEGTSHLHVRYAFVGEKNGNPVIDMKNVLLEHGIDRPDPSKPISKTNNPAQTFLDTTRDALEDYADEVELAHGNPRVNRQRSKRKHSSIGQYKLQQRVEELEKQARKHVAELKKEADQAIATRDAALAEMAEERQRLDLRASKLSEGEEALKNGETDLKMRLKTFEAQAEDVTNRQMTAEALERANAEKWDAIVKESRKLKDERQAFEKEKSDFKDKKKDLVRRETAVGKREAEVARRETGLNDLIKQFGKWWESITNWLGEQLDKARLEEAKRQADENKSVVVKALDEFEYESHEDESMDTFAR